MGPPSFRGCADASVLLATPVSVIKKIITNGADAIYFGPLFLLRHVSRLTGRRLMRVKVPNGCHILTRPSESDVAVIRQIFRDRQYRVDFNESCAARIQRRYDEIIARGETPVIVDAGANIGAASIWFSEHYPKARIVAVEPEPGNFNILAMNIASKPNVKSVLAAIGSEAGFAKVKTSDLAWAARTERNSDGVRVITMAEAFGDGVPFMVKVDIEGFESDLFASNTEWLKDASVVFIEPHDWLFPDQGTTRSFQAAMGSEDYEIHLSGEILTYIRR